jgi:hypothetical protein
VIQPKIALVHVNRCEARSAVGNNVSQPFVAGQDIAASKPKEQRVRLKGACRMPRD